jgi:cytochrome c-type biogenesis protein CcmE
MVAALSAAVLLAGALAYTSFTASSQAVTPSSLLRVPRASGSYELTGTVLAGYRRLGQTLLFRVRDRAGTGAVLVRYRGEVPDPFRAGREVVVTVRRQAGAWVGERDSLITKCPSKFASGQ